MDVPQSLIPETVSSAYKPGTHHDDVIKWKHFPRYWPFVRGIHRSPVNSPHKGQWRGALMFSLICARINGWANNREAGDLRRHQAHCDVIVMISWGVYRHGIQMVEIDCRSVACIYNWSIAQMPIDKSFFIRTWKSTDENLLLSPININLITTIFNMLRLQNCCGKYKILQRSCRYTLNCPLDLNHQ